MSVDRFNSFSTTGQSFYADGSLLLGVVDHYDTFFKLGLTEAQKRDLIADLLAPSAPGFKGVTSRTETEELFDPDGWPR